MAMLEIISQILLGIIAVGLVISGILAILIWIRNLTRKMSILRLFVQIVASIAIFVILLIWPLPWNPILSGLIFSIALRLTIVFALIVASTLVIGRFFCGWLCPFALYMDLLTRLRKALRIPYLNLPERLDNGLNILRYVILAAILVMALVLGPLNADVWRFIIMFMGPFKSLIIVFLTPIEPLVTQIGEALGFNNWGTSFHDLSGTIHYFNGDQLILLTWIVFFAFTAGSFMVRLLWCRFCPLGATFSILNRFAPFRWVPLLRINKVEEKCTKCGICKRVCPVQVTEVYEQKGGKIMTSMCMLCLRCVEMCPYEDCLRVNLGGKTVFKSRNWLEPSDVE
jgi:ferredoxin-type protein NapH